MAYPRFPQTGNSPAFLDPFDPLFMAEAITDITGDIAASANSWGGAVITIAPWRVTGAVFPSPVHAIFGWAYINILSGGNSITQIDAMPQIVGPRFAWMVLDAGGRPILT